MRYLAALALLFTMTTACGSDQPASNSVTVTASGPVTLKVGQTLIVALPSNPSTGYRWFVTVAPDPKVLAQQGEPTYQAAPSATPMPGSGGTETTTFTATAAGATKVVLSYRRSFEPDQPDANTVTLAVVISG